MFQTAIRRSVPLVPRTAASASALATRKQIEPTASGAQTRRCCSLTDGLWSSASKVVTLKELVPTSWTRAAHQSSSSMRGVCLSWWGEAAVKKIRAGEEDGADDLVRDELGIGRSRARRARSRP